jgi:diadenosine tetraphosphatase ApaH/serine/threonine PP2A family protein phosphatase
LQLTPSSFYFINPGSVGHPRESDYRAQYAIYDRDRDTVTFRQVHYDRREMLRENSRHGIATDLGPTVAAYRLGAMLRRIKGSIRGSEAGHGR